MHGHIGQAAEVDCASLVNEDSYEAPYLNIDRERASMDVLLYWLSASLPPRRPPCVCLSNAESPLRMPSASNASLRQAGRQSVSQPLLGNVHLRCPKDRVEQKKGSYE